MDLFTLILWLDSFLSLRELPHTHVSSVLNGILQVNPLKIPGVLCVAFLSEMLPSSFSVLASQVCPLNSGNCHFLPGFPSLQHAQKLSPARELGQSTFDNIIFKKFSESEKKKKKQQPTISKYKGH